MYKLTNAGNIFCIENNSFIPTDAENADYQAYLLWVADGNSPDSADDLPTPDAQISPRQVRMAMTQMNLRTLVESAVANGDQNLQDWYQFSTVFERNHPQVLAMAQALNISSQDLDALWALGATL